MDFSQDDKSWRGTMTECVWLSLVALGPVRDGYGGVGGTSSVAAYDILKLEKNMLPLSTVTIMQKSTFLNYYIR